MMEIKVDTSIPNGKRERHIHTDREKERECWRKREREERDGEREASGREIQKPIKKTRK